jgi:hypothetical protein
MVDLRAGARWQRTHVVAAVSNLLDRRYALYGVFADNPKGPYGGPAPASEHVERFLTPAYPRTRRREHLPRAVTVQRRGRKR